MTIGESAAREELVKTLRGMNYSDLDLSFFSGKDSKGQIREGYDRYGKYKIRFGWGAGAFLSASFAFITFESFTGGRSGRDYNSPESIWIRQNSYWTIPIWAIVTYFLWRANRKVEQADLMILAPAMEKNGLEVLPKGTRFPGDLNIPLANDGTYDKAAFAVMESDKIRIAFGLSYLWWDMSSKDTQASAAFFGLFGRGASRRPTHFVYVAVPDLSGEFVYLNPKTAPDWNLLPPMSEKAKASLTQLASGFAVVIGGGGIGVGHAAGANEVDISWQSNRSVRSVFETSYKILNTQLADIVEGLI